MGILRQDVFCVLATRALMETVIGVLAGISTVADPISTHPLTTTFKWVGFGRLPAIITSQKKNFSFRGCAQKGGRPVAKGVLPELLPRPSPVFMGTVGDAVLITALQSATLLAALFG